MMEESTIATSKDETSKQNTWVDFVDDDTIRTSIQQTDDYMKFLYGINNSLEEKVKSGCKHIDIMDFYLEEAKHIYNMDQMIKLHACLKSVIKSFSETLKSKNESEKVSEKKSSPESVSKEITDTSEYNEDEVKILVKEKIAPLVHALLQKPLFPKGKGLKEFEELEDEDLVTKVLCASGEGSDDNPDKGAGGSKDNPEGSKGAPTSDSESSYKYETALGIDTENKSTETEEEIFPDLDKYFNYNIETDESGAKYFLETCMDEWSKEEYFRSTDLRKLARKVIKRRVDKRLVNTFLNLLWNIRKEIIQQKVTRTLADLIKSDIKNQSCEVQREFLKLIEEAKKIKQEQEDELNAKKRREMEEKEEKDRLEKEKKEREPEAMEQGEPEAMEQEPEAMEQKPTELKQKSEKEIRRETYVKLGKEKEDQEYQKELDKFKTKLDNVKKLMYKKVGKKYLTNLNINENVKEEFEEVLLTFCGSKIKEYKEDIRRLNEKVITYEDSIHDESEISADDSYERSRSIETVIVKNKRDQNEEIKDIQDVIQASLRIMSLQADSNEVPEMAGKVAGILKTSAAPPTTEEIAQLSQPLAHLRKESEKEDDSLAGVKEIDDDDSSENSNETGKRRHQPNVDEDNSSSMEVDNESENAKEMAQLKLQQDSSSEKDKEKDKSKDSLSSPPQKKSKSLED